MLFVCKKKRLASERPLKDDKHEAGEAGAAHKTRMTNDQKGESFGLEHWPLLMQLFHYDNCISSPAYPTTETNRTVYPKKKKPYK